MRKVDYSRRSIINMIKHYLLACCLSTQEQHLLKKTKKKIHFQIPQQQFHLFGNTKFFCLTTLSESTLVLPYYKAELIADFHCHDM